MQPLQIVPGRTLYSNETELLWFGGTSYLGMPYNAQFQELIKEGLSVCGANWGSSRNNPIQINVFDKVEAFLADFVAAPASITTSSGMLAGQIVLNFLNKTYLNSEIIYAPSVHPALWGANYQPYNGDFISFENTINYQIENSVAETVIIVADSVSSPHFEQYDFDWVKRLPQHKQIVLVIDDSHSLGVMGQGGSGVYKIVKAHSNITLLVIASLNKALGTPGGVIFGDKTTLEKVRKSTFFSACSPMAPAYAYACSLAGNIYGNALAILRQNIANFNEFISPKYQFGNLKGHAAYCFSTPGLNDYLLKNNIFVPCFSYPNIDSTPINRLVISSLHSDEDLGLLKNSLLSFFEK
jgi:8-amino-7-oxononanoate synthase